MDLAGQLAGELFELSMALDRVGNAAAARIGVNQTDLICLTLLSRRGPMSSGEVAAELGLTNAAISAMAGRLEKHGYVTREIDPNDRRRVLLSVQQEGAEQAFAMFDGVYQAMVELFGEYEERDLRKLAEILPRFRAILQDWA
ncbi:MarR family transcriptional regulator [Kibdelosporangium philippinense]|uniref:MarR family transcriptional regulator n=2 Tax=Kibdelosporangium philippinense TaxID=211113 RepID=A0ABS8ZP77_9PSEU|nr:MarR family transcriptional regulator [Kibdelosporangium philippinense]MCE7008283.1 MarR family transcriptional regulator [Kibdelosporangium philippinense]